MEKDTKLRNKFYNGKIYKIVDNTNDNVYIGSCCSSLKTRLSKHKCSYEMFLFHNIKSFEIIKNGDDYIKSFDIIKNNDYKIELLENCNIKTKQELFQKERYYIENNVCLNKNIPGRTDKEYYNDNQDKKKIYRDANKDKIKRYRDANKDKQNEYNRNYRVNNKDKTNEKFECECGGKYTRCHKARHLRTTKHQEFIKSNN